jgi:hypothetical protein
MLAYLRRSCDQSVLVEMNFSGQKLNYSPPTGHWRLLLTTSKGSPGVLSQHEIQLLILE